MKERPILFSAEMVRAILEGRKTQTRRVITSQNSITVPHIMRKEWKELRWDEAWLDGGPSPAGNPGPYWHVPFRDIVVRVYPRVQPGDVIWVREAHRLTNCECTEACRGPGHVWYEADHSGYENVSLEKLRPSIHMPRWASRIDLEITDIRVERVQEISEEDAKAEGVQVMGYGDYPSEFSGKHLFESLWDSINGKKHPWSDNPWVWVVEFGRA
jgi:hypothetical protein